jgi:hypothetical protein
MSGEGSSADNEASKKWCQNVTPIIKQYAPKDFLLWMNGTVLQCTTEENASYQRQKAQWRKSL